MDVFPKEITFADLGQKVAPGKRHYYRYDAMVNYDYMGRLTIDGSFLFYHECEILRETPCGVWVNFYGTEKLVIHHHKKKFAHPTKKAALESYYKRKAKQVELLKVQLMKAEISLILTKDINGNPITT